MYNNQLHVFVADVRPITDMDEITSHFLHVIYVHLQNAGRKVTQMATDKNGGSARSDRNEKIGNQIGLSAMQREVMQLIVKSPDADSDEGVSVQDIVMVMNNVSKDRIRYFMLIYGRGVIDELIDEGLLFFTTDDDHVKPTVTDF